MITSPYRTRRQKSFGILHRLVDFCPSVNVLFLEQDPCTTMLLSGLVFCRWLLGKAMKRIK